MPFVQNTSGVRLSKTIFIEIASVDDEELVHTVNSIFTNASISDRVFVGISFSGKYAKRFREIKSLAKKYKNVRYTMSRQKRNDITTLGVGIGRYNAYQLYQGEDYLLQVDSHSYFSKSWDKILINLFEDAVKEVGDKKIVLTCIPPIYGYDADERVIRVGPKTRYPEWNRNRLLIETIPEWSDFDVYQKNLSKFIPCVKACPAMMFGNKEFAKDIGVNKGSIFYDEDLIHTYELFGRGMAFVFPNISNFPIAHLDSDRIVKGHGRTFFLSYLNETNNIKIHEKLKQNYLDYINNPNNKEKIEKYKKYAKVHPTIGYFSSVREYVPEEYR
jgi:hypothetical protein